MLPLGAALWLLAGLHSATAGTTLVYGAEEKVRMEPSVKQFGGKHWQALRGVRDDDAVRLHFFLRHPKATLEAFDEELRELADPASERYGRWLSASEVKARLQAPPEAIRAVYDFLVAHGAEEVDLNPEGDILRATMPAPRVETMLATELRVFGHRRFGSLELVRSTAPYFLPASVAPYVNIVGDLLRLPRVDAKEPVPLTPVAAAKPDTDPRLRTSASSPSRKAAEVPDEFQSCGLEGATTPAVLQKQYGIAPLRLRDLVQGNAMAVAEFQLQFYDEADLSAFSGACDTRETSVDEVYGGNKGAVCRLGGNLCIEALLDIEYIGAMAEPIPLSVYYSRDYSLLDWIELLGTQEAPELVHSVSYGNDEDQQVSEEYMESINVEFMKLGSRGISVLFASGDQGVWGREGVAGRTFHADFPAASPYVTAVGGTDLATKSVFGEERAWVSGGGGFSETFATPAWQQAQVDAYLASDVELPDAAKFNAGGRGYPDLSALAGQQNAYYVAYGGGRKDGGVAGTSAACPVVAAVFAQLNNMRLAAGKPPMGFLNPWIYAHADAFNDVVLGENNAHQGKGFKATRGWDPATGVGTPNFEKLAALV